MPSTARQHRFVAEYQVDLNAAQAALRAGYSARTAPQQGSRLLKNVEVQAGTSSIRTIRVPQDAARVEPRPDRAYIAQSLQACRSTGDRP